jgi:hypothetical protein
VGHPCLSSVDQSQVGLECVVHGYISVDLREANKLPFGGPEGLAQVKRTLGGESGASTGQISWKPDVAG